MEMPEQSWELDELETVKGMVQLYRAQLDRLERDDRIRYIGREEYVQVTRSMIRCMETSVRQTERIIGCIERIVDSVARLSDEVIELKNQIDGEEQEEF